MFTSLKDSARQAQEAQRKAEREENVRIEQIKKLVDADFADREAAVEKRERAMAARVARLNESMNLIVAALRDSGHGNLAEIISRKVSGEWAEKDQ
jgi:uncharacterized membrane protein YqiK